MNGFMSPCLAVIALSMVEANMQPEPDLAGGMARYNVIDDVFGLYAVHTNSEKEQVNKSRFWVEKPAWKRRETCRLFLRNRLFSPGP